MKNSTQRGQIISFLQEQSEAKTAEIIEKIDGHPIAIKTELKRLLERDEIVKVKHGVYALSDRDTQHPQPRPPIPSRKPKPSDIKIETPFPELYDKNPSVRDIKAERDTLLSTLNAHDPTPLCFDYEAERDTLLSSLTYSDIFQNICYWNCALFTGELRKVVQAEQRDLSQTEQERLIEKSRKVTLLYIDSFKNMLTFEDRARLSISLTQYKQQHFEVSPAFYDPKITQDSLKRKPPPITGVLK